MKFSLILASRDRVHLLQNLIDSVKATALDINNIEFVVICDDDDITTNSFKSDVNLKMISRPRSTWMHRDYINWAYPYTSGEYIIVLNDDTIFVTHHWDQVDLTGVYYGFTETNTGDKLCCFPLLSRKAIDYQGFIMPNERKSWGADHDVFHAFYSPAVNKITRVPIEIKHISHHTQTREKDDINQRVQDIHEWDLLVPNGFYADRISARINKEVDKSPKEILVIYNICGISRNENHNYYCQAINSILSQNFPSFRLVISGCFVDEKIKKILHEQFGTKISYLWTDDKYPLNITFNYAVKKCISEYGEFKAYLYVDSGVTFGLDKNVISKMYDRIKKGYAMVASKVDADDGYESWGLHPKENEDFVVPLGKAVNLHCQMFHEDVYRTYNALAPDIFASDTSESISTFLCAAINKKWVVTHDVKLHHEFNMDGASSGFRHKHPLLFRSKKSIQDICAEGKLLGFGYEEINYFCMHNSTKYDQDGNPLDERLLPFLKENLFLNDSFDYTKISGSFFPQLIGKKTLPSPKITCIIVSHNKPDYCKEAIQSVLNQDMDDWQAILMDSGNLLKKHHFDYIQDPRFKIVESGEDYTTKRHRAMAPFCFNECFRKGYVQGELVVYLCDDDIFYPNAFSTFVNYAEENPQCMAMYASQDIAIHYPNGKRVINGERRALVPRGLSCSTNKFDCIVDYLQFCHKRTLWGDDIHWSEARDTEHHADGIFMDKIGSIVAVHPIDIKVGQNRRTILSTFNPSR